MGDDFRGCNLHCLVVAASSLVYDSVQKLFRQTACCNSGCGAQAKASCKEVQAVSYDPLL